jgi:hypothetical protein
MALLVRMQVLLPLVLLPLVLVVRLPLPSVQYLVEFLRVALLQLCRHTQLLLRQLYQHL